MKGIDLGEQSAFPDLPAKIDIGHDPYWLVKTSNGEYRLLSGICPHAGGEIRLVDGGVLLCPLHFWTFDTVSGDCTSVPGERLLLRQVTVSNGRLIASEADE